MRINIQSNGFVLTEGLREHIIRRMQFALGWASAATSKLVVSLSDINGPRGGRDKRCKIQVSLVGGKGVVIEDTEDDLYVAIDRAADRADRAVARQLERLREYPHQKLLPDAVVQDDKDAPTPQMDNPTASRNKL